MKTLLFATIGLTGVSVQAANVKPRSNDEVCPEYCQCNYTPAIGMWVSCSGEFHGGRYETLPKFPESMTRLQFNGQDIRSLDSSINDFSNYTLLEFVDISDNNYLSFISPDFFAGNLKLYYVVADNIGIKYFPGLTVPDLMYLRTNGPNNLIESFDMDEFVESNLASKLGPSIRMIIGGPNLKTIKADSRSAIVRNSNVEDSLFIDELSDEAEIDVTKATMKLPCLTDLDIQSYSGNVSRDSMGLAKLSYSFPFYDTLKRFQLTSVSVQSFLDLPSAMLPTKLTNLGLTAAQIFELDAKFLAEFKSLEEINLNHNYLNSVPFDKRSNPALKHADLSYNNLKHLAASELPEGMTSMLVEGNDFECDCSDVEHQRFINENWEEYTDEMKSALNYRCTNREGNQFVKDVELTYCSKTKPAWPTTTTEPTTTTKSTTTTETTTTAADETTTTASSPVAKMAFMTTLISLIYI